MFDRLDQLEARYEELSTQLSDPNIVSDQENYRQVSKAHRDLEPVVDKFREYRKLRTAVVRAPAITANAAATSPSSNPSATQFGHKFAAAAPKSPCRRYATVSATSVHPETAFTARVSNAPPAFSFRGSASANGCPARYKQNRPASPTDSVATRPTAAAIAARFFSRPVSPASSSANRANSPNNAIPGPPCLQMHYSPQRIPRLRDTI